jgi:hypothetical protein
MLLVGGALERECDWGWNVWEDVVPLLWAANGTTKKVKIKYIVTLDGRR